MNSISKIALNNTVYDIEDKEARNSYKPNLLEFKWSDHILNDESWTRADTFSWQDGTVYEDAYNHLVDDIDGMTSTTETIGSYTITVYVASDGHKIVMSDQETTLSNIYNESGIAWYYILDTTNERFKLPRTKWGFVGIRDSVGNYIAAGLPNITGQFNVRTGNWGDYDGAFFWKESKHDGAANSYSGSIIGFDASRSNSIYGNSNTVQSPSTQMYLYFYVGQFSQSAIEQTAGLNSELFNDKADIDLNNVPNNIGSTAKSYFAELPMPSDSYVDLTPVTSGSLLVTAPANGYVYLEGTATTSLSYCALDVNHIYSQISWCTAGVTNGLCAFVPVRKGADVYMGAYNFATTYCKFIYAKGEI